MVVTSNLPLCTITAIVVALSIGACTPDDDTPVFESALTNTDPRVTEVQTGLALASAAVDEQDPGDGLAELLTAADLVTTLPPTDESVCEFGVGASAIADEMVEQGAYKEARMAYAVAIHFVEGCGAEGDEAVLPEQLRASALRLRQQDARAVHQWSLASAKPG